MWRGQRRPGLTIVRVPRELTQPLIVPEDDTRRLVAAHVLPPSAAKSAREETTFEYVRIGLRRESAMCSAFVLFPRGGGPRVQLASFLA